MLSHFKSKDEKNTDLFTTHWSSWVRTRLKLLAYANNLNTFRLNYFFLLLCFYLTWEKQDLFLDIYYIYLPWGEFLNENNTIFIILMTIQLLPKTLPLSLVLRPLQSSPIALGLPNCCLTFNQIKYIYIYIYIIYQKFMFFIFLSQT